MKVEAMRLLVVVMVIFFWISIWGLSDILVTRWTSEEKITYYLSILAVIAVIVITDPTLVRHF
jgi:hypothetical protein